jgi:hypothetical protein
MVGRRAAELFRDHVPDPETADAIAEETARLKQEEDDRLTKGNVPES